MCRVGTMTAALLLGVASVAAGQEPGHGFHPARGGEGLLDSLFASPSSEKKPAAPAVEERAAEPATPAQAARSRERLMNTFLRRQAVCDRLREIAAQTGNDELDREAERLGELAWKIYLQETGTAAADEAALSGHHGKEATAPRAGVFAEEPGRPQQREETRSARVREEER